jgi:hypothetical protein
MGPTPPRRRNTASPPTPPPAATESRARQPRWPWCSRLAARLRDLERRLTRLDESLDSGAAEAPLLELDEMRAQLQEAAAACDALPTAGVAPAVLEEAVKRLAWAVQSLEACRQLDDTFVARLGEMGSRLAEVRAALDALAGREG